MTKSNTTVITVEWIDFASYYRALEVVSKSIENDIDITEEGAFNFQLSASTKFYKPFTLKNEPVYSRVKLMRLMEKFKCGSKCRKKPYVHYRQLIWYYCWHVVRKNDKISWTELGLVTGHNHATVIYGVNSVQALIDSKDKPIMEMMDIVYKACDEVFNLKSE